MELKEPKFRFLPTILMASPQFKVIHKLMLGGKLNKKEQKIYEEMKKEASCLK